jgi:hypothetical protein
MHEISVHIVYAINRSTTQLSGVPVSCSIKRVKVAVAKANNMDDSSPIRVIHKGRILADELLLGRLVEESQTEITLYVTGVPRPAYQPSPPGKQGPKRGTNLVMSDVWLKVAIMVGLVVVFGFTFRHKFLDVLVKEDPIRTLIVAGLALSCILIVWRLVNWIWKFKRHQDIIKECVVQFVLTFLPVWDGEAFKRDHGIV